MFHVYYLLEPDNQTIRYVGFTGKTPTERLKAHINERQVTHRRNWVKSLLSQSQSPLIQTVVIVQTIEEAKRIEVALISMLRSRGIPLINATNGGDGLVGYVASAETRKKLSIINTGKIFSPERRAAISRANKGKKHTITERVRAAQHAMKNQATSREIREKISRSRGNTSGARGVTYRVKAKSKPYEAFAMHRKNGKVARLSLGYYATLVDAVRARQTWEDLLGIS